MIHATNILDFVLQKKATLLKQNLSSVKHAVHSAPEVKTSESAVFVIDQQASLINGLQRALNESMKVAAALAEAATLAKDGLIDSSDVIDYARRALIDGTVKVSSLNGIFDQSPGQIISSGNASQSGKALDPLTSTLRSIASP